jgi:hypothetical protein
MEKQITHKQQERVITKGILVLVMVFVIFALISGFIPRQWRLLTFAVMLLFGVLVYGAYIVPRVSENLDQVLWGYTGISMLMVAFSGLFYSISLKEAGVLGDREGTVLILGIVGPLCLISGFLVYETIDYRKRDGKLSFHLKRFLGRTSLAAIFFVIFFVFVAMLSFVSPTSDVATGGLVLASVTTALILYVISRRTRTRELLSKLEKGEW